MLSAVVTVTSLPPATDNSFPAAALSAEAEIVTSVVEAAVMLVSSAAVTVKVSTPQVDVFSETVLDPVTVTTFMLETEEDTGTEIAEALLSVSVSVPAPPSMESPEVNVCEPATSPATNESSADVPVKAAPLLTPVVRTNT
jgi:hypothetical protein